MNTAIFAQTRTITGTVSEENGPLPGATVLVKGATKGSQTDFDGTYTIQARDSDILVFSYVGYTRQEVKVGKQQTIDVILEASIHLDEVVVTAQGLKREKKAVGYAVTAISSEQLENRTDGDVARVLSGKASGVSITNASGVVGSASHIQIRGINSPPVGNISKLNKLESSIKSNAGKQLSKSDSSTSINYIVDGVLIHPSLNQVIEEMDAKEVEHKVTYSPKRTKELFGGINGQGCVVITTKKGNYRIENDESYKELFENQFKSVSFDPLSTFSIDVDKASYSNVRRMINNGQKIPIDAVKIEELINYFEYGYEAPKDNAPFAVHTEVAQTPWNNETLLMKIGLKGKEIATEALPPSNLTFLLDVSGSMSSPNKLPLLKSALKVLVDNLRKEDKVAIVVYAGAAGVVLEPTSGDKKKKILSAINNLNAGGSTAGGQGIELAYALAQKHFKKEGNNRVILATDGDFNVGMSSDKEMQKLIEEKRKSGVFLTCIGFGMGNYKDSKLETLADKGNGNYAYIDTMQEAHKFLGKEFSGTLYTIAKDVKIQVEFNPATVKSYRLIGYENRLLNNEDFKDDTKDAGEIGAGHTVTALYEVVPATANYEPTSTSQLKYQSTKENFNRELLTVKLRYKEPNGEKSKYLETVVENVPTANLTSDFKFISAIAMFGMQLRESKYVADISVKDIIDLAYEGRGEDKDGFRSEFIRLIKANR